MLLCSGAIALACSKPDAKAEHNAPSAAPNPVTPPEARSSPPAATSSAKPATSPPKVPPPDQDRSLPLRVSHDAGSVPAAQAQRILHVGDSMVPLVGNYLRKILRRDGRRYEIVSIPSSSTLSWARGHGMRDAMYRYAPQVVLISLGSNELFDPNPQRRAKAIRQIVSETRGRPCMWIGPPAWKKDKGFLRVLRDNVGTCRYFDSAKLSLERMADGRHPSWSGSHAWASAVWHALGGSEPVPTGNVRPKP